MMGDILFLSHRIPFPPDRGDKIRSNHLLKSLAEIAPVHVGCFADTASDREYEGALESAAASHCMLARSKSLPRAGIEAVASRRPISVAAFDHRGLHAWVRRTLREHPIDRIVVFSGQMGQYVPNDFTGRVIVDLCDVNSAKFDEYAAKGRWPRSLIDRREGRLLANMERALTLRAERTLLISEAEAALFRSRASGVAHDRIMTVGNGIDADRFDPVTIAPHSALTDQPGPHLVFTGQMDYRPNIDAVERVIEALLPAIRAEVPTAQFHIVGRAPLPELVAHDGKNGVRVWGEVPDVRPFLAAADLVVAPLTIARGVQNKVLEAMAMARPVLLTPQAATGIEAIDKRDFHIAHTDEDLIDAALVLLRDDAKAAVLGRNARQFVLDNQSWPAMLAPFERLVRNCEGQARDAA